MSGGVAVALDGFALHALIVFMTAAGCHHPIIAVVTVIL
jgi:hypothetical protein